MERIEADVAAAPPLPERAKELLRAMARDRRRRALEVDDAERSAR
jgi:hypothetical protein